MPILLFGGYELRILAINDLLAHIVTRLLQPSQ